MDANMIVRILFKTLMFFLAIFGGFVQAQNETMFSHTFLNPAFVNPGYAGSDTSGYYNVMVMNKDQLIGFTAAPSTTVINVNGPVHIGGVPGGISVSFYRDQFGFINTPVFNLGYSYRAKVGKGSLGLGLSAGVFFSTIDPQGWILPENSSDPVLPTENATKQSLDIGLGAYYSAGDFYAGLSVTHLTTPVLYHGDNASKMSSHYYLMSGYKFVLNNPDVELRPSLLVLSDLNNFLYSINMVLFYQNKFWTGLDYKFGTSLGLIAGLNLLPDLRLSYSYGYNTSSLSKFSNGNHEIALTYRFSVYFEKGKQKYKSVRYL